MPAYGNAVRILASLAVLSGGHPSFAQVNQPSALERGAALIHGRLIESHGVVYRAIRVESYRDRYGPQALYVFAVPVYYVERKPGPRDDMGRPTHFDLTVKRDACLKSHPGEVNGDTLLVLVDKTFVHWTDALRAAEPAAKPRRPYMPPAILPPDDLAKAEKCSKHADYGYADMPLDNVEIYSGNERIGAQVRPQRGMWSQVEGSECADPRPITRVSLEARPGFTGRFSVSVQAVSGLQCKWPDRTRGTGRSFKHGLSAPVEMHGEGTEFSLADFGSLWKMPPFPEFTSAEVAAALEEPVNEAVCVPIMRGHRVDVKYDGSTIYSRDIYAAAHCAGNPDP